MVLSNKAILKSKVPIWQHGDRKEEDEMICAENQRDGEEQNMNRTTKTKIKVNSRSKKAETN